MCAVSFRFAPRFLPLFGCYSSVLPSSPTPQVAEAASSPYTWRFFCLLIWPGVVAVLIILHLLRKLLFGW